MSEEDVKEIHRHLKVISEWQINHEIADTDRSEKIPLIIKDVVETQINGNLRDIKKHLEKQDTKLDEMEVKIDALKVETAPIIESKNTIISLRKFLLWVATPITIIWAALKYIFGR